MSCRAILAQHERISLERATPESEFARVVTGSFIKNNAGLFNSAFDSLRAGDRE